MGDLKTTSITLTQEQISHGTKKAGNLSRYIRSLIDRDMGGEGGGQQLMRIHQELAELGRIATRLTLGGQQQQLTNLNQSDSQN